MQFEIDDEILSTEKAPPSIVKAISVLDSLPDGKLLTFLTLAEKTGITVSHIRGFAIQYFSEHSFLAYYKGTHKRLFGNRKTVATWNEQNKK